MTYVDELNKLPNFWKTVIRKLENIRIKLVKAKWSACFNNVCLKENLLPCYTRKHNKSIKTSKSYLISTI